MQVCDIGQFSNLLYVSISLCVKCGSNGPYIMELIYGLNDEMPIHSKSLAAGLMNEN